MKQKINKKFSLTILLRECLQQFQKCLKKTQAVLCTVIKIQQELNTLSNVKNAEKFEFTKKKIEDAREAYLAGDVTKANDILTAANIQQYGIQANATQYFADSTTPVAPSDPASPVTASGLTQQQEDRIQAVMRTNPTKSRAEVIEAMQKEGKL